MACSAIVVAGGSGSRFGGHKQFAMLGGQSLAGRSIAQCRSVADFVVLVVPQGMTKEAHGADAVVEGGSSRSMSVRAGLALLDEDSDLVIIHDAARPLASEQLFRRVVAALDDQEVDGVIPGIQVNDTVKQVTLQGGRRVVSKTLDRDSLVLIQTPQGFRHSALQRAHLEGAEATDDAALLEAQGGMVLVVNGEAGNIKITSPDDLVLAQTMVEQVP